MTASITTGTIGGTTDVAAPTPADSMTASITTGTIGGTTDVAAPTPAVSARPNESSSHGDEEAAMPTAHVASHSRQDECDDENSVVDFSVDRLDNNNGNAGEGVGASEGERERNMTSPNTVAADLSTETAAIKGSTESVNDINRKRKSPSENIDDDKIIESPPMLPRRTQLLNPLENAQDYHAKAQGDSINLQNCTEEYFRRLNKKLIKRGHSLKSLIENEPLIRFAAESTVTRPVEIPEGVGFSQADCDLIESELQAND